MRQTLKNVSPMSNEGRNAYVIQHITDALLKLLQDKPINDISISELCDLACIGRASFYRNFESKEDILKAYVNQIFHEWIDKCNQNDSYSLSGQIKAMFSHFEAHYNFYHLLSERGLIYLLKDILIGIYGPKPEHSKIEAYTTAFVTYSIYGWIEVWFQRGMQDSAEEIAKLFEAQGL